MPCPYFSGDVKQTVLIPEACMFQQRACSIAPECMNHFAGFPNQWQRAFPTTFACMLTCCVLCSSRLTKKKTARFSIRKQVQRYRTWPSKILMHFQESQATEVHFRKKNNRFLSQFQIALPSNKRTFTQNKSRHVNMSHVHDKLTDADTSCVCVPTKRHSWSCVLKLNHRWSVTRKKGQTRLSVPGCQARAWKEHFSWRWWSARSMICKDTNTIDKPCNHAIAQESDIWLMTFQKLIALGSLAVCFVLDIEKLLGKKCNNKLPYLATFKN